MRSILVAAIASLFIIGCKDGATAPPGIGRIVVNFSSGFQGDSIQFFTDAQYRIAFRGYSTRNPVGCMLAEEGGVHSVSLYLPELNVAGGVIILVQDSATTNVNAKLDRTNRNLTLELGP